MLTLSIVWIFYLKKNTNDQWIKSSFGYFASLIPTFDPFGKRPKFCSQTNVGKFQKWTND
jgi:hypothetical protein